jgi:hypothetical protein
VYLLIWSIPCSWQFVYLRSLTGLNKSSQSYFSIDFDSFSKGREMVPPLEMVLTHAIKEMFLLQSTISIGICGMVRKVYTKVVSDLNPTKRMSRKNSIAHQQIWVEIGLITCNHIYFNIATYSQY